MGRTLTVSQYAEQIVNLWDRLATSRFDNVPEWMKLQAKLRKLDQEVAASGTAEQVKQEILYIRSRRHHPAGKGRMTR